MGMLKDFQMGPPVLLDLFGPVGHKDDAERFYNEWRQQGFNNGAVTFLVGRKDNAPGCFSLRRMTEGWDVAFYEETTPKQALADLKANRTPEDPIYFATDVKNKYIYQDLVKFLKERDLW